MSRRYARGTPPKGGLGALFRVGIGVALEASHFGRATSRFAPGRAAAAYGFPRLFPHQCKGEMNRMRNYYGRCCCAYCDAVLDLPWTKSSQVVLRAASHRANVRGLFFDGNEIHRCEIGETKAVARGSSVHASIGKA